MINNKGEESKNMAIPMSDDQNALEMAKKRDHKIMITEEAINKIPRVKYKDIPESEYDNLWDLAKDVLKISKEENDSNEVAITYSLDSAKMIEQGERYIALFNEAVDKNNEAEKLKDLQNAATYFLKNSHNVGIDYDNR